MTWDQSQELERQWWGDCRNTFAEELKQVAYARRMGIQRIERTADGTIAVFPSFEGMGKDIVDIGGGPVSMLLKTYGAQYAMVVDPCVYPDWVRERYSLAGITSLRAKGEDFTPDRGWEFDEAWIYNVLEHTEDPQKVIENARSVAEVVRVFEWVDYPHDDVHDEMHPHHLTAASLDEWLGGKGTVEPNVRLLTFTDEIPGTAYYGVFDGIPS